MKYVEIKTEKLNAMYNDVSEKRRKWVQAETPKAREKAEADAKEAKKDFEAAVLQAVTEKCFEGDENPIITFMRDPALPLLKMSEKSLNQVYEIRENTVFAFVKGFESLTGIDTEKRNKFCPSADWMDKLEIARKACVGYVAMQETEKQEAFCEKFENSFDSGKRQLQPLEREKGVFSKRACKRSLEDLLKAIFGESFRCLKDAQVNSVLQKVNKSKRGESYFCSSAKEFFGACVPMMTAYASGADIKQRWNKMTESEKDSYKWDATK